MLVILIDSLESIDIYLQVGNDQINESNHALKSANKRKTFVKHVYADCLLYSVTWYV